MSGTLGTLWSLMRGQRVRYGLAVLATLASVYVMYLVPLIPAAVIDLVFADRSPNRVTTAHRALEALGGRAALGRTLALAAGAWVVVRGAGGAMLYLRGRWSAQAAESIARRLRERLYDHLQHLPCRYHDQTETGDLIQRCTSDVETIRSFLGSQIVEAGRALALLAMGLPFVLYLDTRMGLLSMVLMPVIVAFGAAFFSRVRDVFKAHDEAEGRMTTRLQENLTGIRVVRSFARQDHEIEQFARANGEYRRQWYRLMRVLSWYWPLSDLMCFAQSGIVLVAGAYYVSRGRLTPGDLAAFIMYAQLFLWPVRNLGRVLADMGKAVVSIGRVGEILSQPAEKDEPPASTPTVDSATTDGSADGPPCGQIVIEGLSFNHGPEAPVLQGLSLRVEAGSTLAILGPSGSGKSTLINLLLRLYDYEAGSIRLDGAELRAMPRKSARALIGSVLQEPFLYSRSLRENILLGAGPSRDGPADEAMIQAARAACIHESIQCFEQGYDTLVGERGVTLSGGQRQRVALARALLKDPPVLILDDALSAVDTRTETMILQALRQRHGRRTTVVIAHRLSTLMHADRVVVLDEGRVVQSGTHERLIGVEGMYKRLWQIQTDLAAELAEAPLGPKDR